MNNRFTNGRLYETHKEMASCTCEKNVAFTSFSFLHIAFIYTTDRTIQAVMNTEQFSRSSRITLNRYFFTHTTNSPVPNSVLHLFAIHLYSAIITRTPLRHTLSRLRAAESLALRLTLAVSH